MDIGKHESQEPPTKATEKSRDNANFLLMPRIVWAKCEDPFQLSLWQAIKDIAGENGECYLSTPQLAEYAMMSSGMVTKCRKFLMDKGLVDGEIVRDPGQFNAVWHLTIPNLWGENAAWAFEYPSIRHRMSWKAVQAAEKKARSPHESAPENVEARSCGERPPSPHERPPSPHETIKDLNKDLQKMDGMELLENAVIHSGLSKRDWSKWSTLLENAVYVQNEQGLMIQGLGKEADRYQESLSALFTNALMMPVSFTE